MSTLIAIILSAFTTMADVQPKQEALATWETEVRKPKRKRNRHFRRTVEYYMKHPRLLNGI